MAIVFLMISAFIAIFFMLFYGVEFLLFPLVLALSLLAIVIIYIAFYAVVNLSVDTTKPLKKQNALCRSATYVIPNFLIGMGMISVKVFGKEKIPSDTRFVMISNHRSNDDPLCVLSAMKEYNISFISKPRNMSLPVVGKTAYGAGFLAIDRENDRNALKTILVAADYLKRNLCSIMIYPEGTRSKSENLLPFHAGSFKLPQKAKVPLVVASIKGTERKHKFGFRKVFINILEVISPERLCAMPTKELSEYCRNIIEKDIRVK